MRTTIDLPDDLFRQVKAQAALEGRMLKELIADYVQRGLRTARGEEEEPAGRRRSPLPVIRKAAGAGPVPMLTNGEMQAILDQEDAEREDRLAGR